MVPKIYVHLKNPCFIFMFAVLKNIEPKVFLVDNLELETFHRLTCLSLETDVMMFHLGEWMWVSYISYIWCASLSDWLNQCSCIEAFSCQHLPKLCSKEVWALSHKS